MPAMRFDVAVIGGGHNALTAAAYLARGGLRTVVLERRPLVGGACVTEELWPGFRISRAAYVAGLLRPRVVSELGLCKRGLRLLPRTPSSFTPLEDGRGLLLGPDSAASQQSIRAFSARDAERWPAYETFLDGIARALEPLPRRAATRPVAPSRSRSRPAGARHCGQPGGCGRTCHARSPCCSGLHARPSRAGSRASPCAVRSRPTR